MKIPFALPEIGNEEIEEVLSELMEISSDS